jgi:hypothetical protein
MNICRCRLCSIELRVHRLENAWRTDQLLDRLPPGSLNHVEVF